MVWAGFPSHPPEPWSSSKTASWSAFGLNRGQWQLPALELLELRRPHGRRQDPHSRPGALQTASTTTSPSWPSSPSARPRAPQIAAHPQTISTDCGCCCTCSVGADGTYTTIQQAIDAVPKTGGEICLLAGDFYENVTIRTSAQGCDPRLRRATPAFIQPHSIPAIPGQRSQDRSASSKAVPTSPPSSPSRTASTSSFASSPSSPTTQDIGILMDRKPDQKYRESIDYTISNKNIRDRKEMTLIASVMAGHRRAQRGQASHRAKHRHHAAMSRTSILRHRISAEQDLYFRP